MKKLFAILMALAMLCSLTVSAFAESTEVAALNWDDVKDAVEGFDGSFKQLMETNLMMWIPDIFEEIELDDSDVEAGIVAYLMTEDKDAAVWFTAYEFDMTLEELAEELKEEYPDLDFVEINGVEAIGFTSPDDDVMCVYYMLDDGTALGINFTPISDEDYYSLFSVMVCSIQIMED